MPKKSIVSRTIAEFFPSQFRALLTATGKDFIERSGLDLVRHATLQVLLGHNVRTQTEPLTRQRIAEIGGALIAMFESGQRIDPQFYAQLSQAALTQLRQRGNTREKVWPAQWVLGLTGKQVQNVLRSNDEALKAFIDTFERAIEQAANNLTQQLGELRLILEVGENHVTPPATLNWVDALRLTTTIGCAELAVRGSDKSRYGKLFERLVLGSALTMLGFDLAEKRAGDRSNKVFWLSDSSDDRECDATAIIKPGMIARFDIGFIGIGNPEIVRDKLSRFAREVERGERSTSSTTFVIVDRYPTGPNANSRQLAEKSGTALVQMSMSLWPRELAKEMKARVQHQHSLAGYDDANAEAYIRNAMSSMDVLSFLRGATENDESNSERDLPIN